MAPLPADDIQRRMGEIRKHLHRGAERLADDVRNLTDWRYHVRRHPWATLGLSAAVGFLLMPRRNRRASPDMETLADLAHDGRLVLQPEPQKVKQAGLLAMGFSLLGSVLLRAGVAHASRRLGTILEGRNHQHAPSSNGQEEAVDRKPR